jgi:selenocysteine-specific elongation factor
MTVVIGTAGHIDHGKTTLLRALTGIDADRLPEERRRGMTIDVGYAHLVLDDGTELDFVDVPGHDRLVGNMLVGAGEIDAAILVVAADDGPRAQTLEHLALIDALGITPGIAVVTKADVAGTDRASEVAAEVATLLDGTSLAGSPVVVVSAVSGEGIGRLRAELVRLRDRAILASAGWIEAGRSRIAIDRVFAVKGRGVVVTGTLRGGPLVRGASLRIVPGRIVPGDRSVRARELQVHGRPVETAGTGRTAINLAGVEANDLHRGLVVTNDSQVTSSDRLLVTLRTAMPDRTRARLHLGTAAVDVAVGRSGRDAIDLADGGAAAILRLAGPVAVATGDRFVLRRDGAVPIVGGVVLDPIPSRGVSRRRQTVQRVGALAAAVATGDRTAAATARLELHGTVIAPGAAIALAPDVEAAAADAVLAAIAADGGLTTARTAASRSLRRSVTIDRSVTATAASGVVERLVASGRLVQDGATLKLPGAAPIATADPADEAAMDRLEQALTPAAPPPLAEAARATGASPAAVRALVHAGRIVVLEPDLAYAATTYRGLEATALRLASRGPLTPAALRDATGTSRKFVMAILADLDRRGVLRRTPDGHVPGPRAATTAGAP